MIRLVILLSAGFGCVGLAQAAEPKPDLDDLSRRLHRAVVATLPMKYEDRSNWGQTIPQSNPVRLPRLQRSVVAVGDRWEWPHGAWVRSRVWLDQPDKNLQIRIREFDQSAGKPLRLKIEATAWVHGERERQQWQKGLRLLGLTTRADAQIRLELDVEVAVRVKAGSLPPKIELEPKVLASTLELQEFHLRQVGPLIQGELAKQLGNELKGTLQSVVQLIGPSIKDFANQLLNEDKGKAAEFAAALFQGQPRSK